MQIFLWKKVQFGLSHWLKKGEKEANGQCAILQILKVCFIKAYACFEKTQGKISLPRQNRIIIIFKKYVVKQALRGAEKNFEIVAILNRYKDTFGDFINSSDVEFLNKPEPIDKRLCNAPRSEDSLMELLERDYLDKGISNKLSWLAPKTENFQVH